MALTSCPACSEQVSTDAKACPHCGHPFGTKTPDGREKIRWWLVLLVAAVLGAGFYFYWDRQMDDARRNGCLDAEQWAEDELGIPSNPEDC